MTCIVSPLRHASRTLFAGGLSHPTSIGTIFELHLKQPAPMAGYEEQLRSILLSRVGWLKGCSF